jgi:hypothetical protein
MQKFWYLVGVLIAFLCLTTGPLAAAPPTTTFNLTGVGSGANLAGVYTSPYSGNINGGTTIPVICDDFADDSYVPETWTAYVTQLSSLTPGTSDSYLNWLNTTGSSITVDGYSLNQALAYTVAAVLAIDILTSSGTAQEDYSFALWELFDAPNAFNQLSAYGDSADEATALADLNNAVTYVETNHLSPSAYPNVTIYSYDTGALCGAALNQPCAHIPPQEFITVSMAEPPSPALLGFDLLAVGGLIFISRRRLNRSVL